MEKYPDSSACLLVNGRYDQPEEAKAMQFTQCPEPACDAPAEIVDRFALPSTGGPVEHITVLCLHRHWFMLPVAMSVRVPRSRVGPA